MKRESKGHIKHLFPIQKNRPIQLNRLKLS
jgi:hypothetical protein